MGKKRVFITREIPESGLHSLREECDVKVNPHARNLSQQELMEMSKGAAGLICLLSDKIDREFIESHPELKVIANYAVGYNNIDVQAATENNVKVANGPGVLTEATADLTWSLLLAAARRIVESDNYVRQGKFSGWGPKLLRGHSVYGKTIGIIGFGHIGQAVGKRARGFGMNILYNKRNPLSAKQESELGAEFREIPNLLQEADFITINAPLNDGTYSLLGKAEFELMKKTAVLVNTGRGKIIKEEELVAALQKKEIAAAGLDVYENEPAITPELLKLDNVVLTPHTGSSTYQARSELAELAAKNILAGLKGEEMPSSLN